MKLVFQPGPDFNLQLFHTVFVAKCSTHEIQPHFLLGKDTLKSQPVPLGLTFHLVVGHFKPQGCRLHMWLDWYVFPTVSDERFIARFCGFYSGEFIGNILINRAFIEISYMSHKPLQHWRCLLSKEDFSPLYFTHRSYFLYLHRNLPTLRQMQND